MDVGVVGVGAMGKIHAHIDSELRPVSSRYLFDMNAVAAAEFGRRCGATRYTNPDEVLKLRVKKQHNLKFRG